MPTDVRLSFANLVSHIRNKDTGEVAAVGIVDARKFNEKGLVQLTAIGGAATMLPGQAVVLEKVYKARFKNEDARFTIPEVNMYAVVRYFNDGQRLVREHSALREFVEEMVGEPVGGVTVLTAEEAAQCTEEYLYTIQQAQPDDGKGTSLNAGDERTYRFFSVFVINAPGPVYSRILESKIVRRLSEADLDTTRFGATRGRTSDGIEMSDNLGNWVPGLASA